MISSQDQIARLKGLLERVQRNAGAPRGRAAALTSPTPAPEPEADEEEEPEPAMAAPMAAAQAFEETTMVRAIEEPSEEVLVEISEPTLEEVELLEEEIVDITDAPPEAEVEIEEPEEEELPASSRRPIAASMSEALADAADSVELDEGREIPLKTPPPESGPQAAPPPAHALAAPLLPLVEEADIMSRPHHPTVAQLGATVELEEGGDAELELGEPVAEGPPVHLVREEAPVERVRPQVVERPAIATAAPASAFVAAAKGFQPASFAELLDASLGLGG